MNNYTVILNWLNVLGIPLAFIIGFNLNKLILNKTKQRGTNLIIKAQQTKYTKPAFRNLVLWLVLFIVSIWGTAKILTRYVNSVSTILWVVSGLVLWLTVIYAQLCVQSVYLGGITEVKNKLFRHYFKLNSKTWQQANHYMETQRLNKFDSNLDKQNIKRVDPATPADPSWGTNEDGFVDYGFSSHENIVEYKSAQTNNHKTQTKFRPK